MTTMTHTMTRQTRRILGALTAALVVIAPLVWVTAPAQAASPMQVTVTIHNVWELDCDDNEFISLGLFETCGYDYYAIAFFPGSDDTSPRAADDATDISPNWQLSGTFDRDGGTFPIRIQLWDHDTTSGNDQIDISSGDDNLDIMVDPRTGDFSGDVPAPNIGWSTGSGDESASIYFSVTFGPSVDIDGDGIHDGLERSAIGVDKFGNIPQGGALRSVPANSETGGGIPIPANPCQSTVLVENDHMSTAAHNHRPVQAAIDDSVSTFAAGDRPAPGSCPYAGYAAKGGIQLLMVIDDQLAETTPVTWGPAAPGVNSGEAIRDNNGGDANPANDTFDPRLRPWYHYALWADSQPGTTSSGLCCANNGNRPDILITLGGFTGNVGDAKEQAGTFMHELGHSLGLGHGGGDTTNCKPNYVSIMNYTYQFTGVPDASITPTFDFNKDGTLDNRDQFRMDFSRQALLGLDEDELSETTPIGTSSDLFLWDGDGTNPLRPSPINAQVNWDRDNPSNIDPGTLAADVNFTADSGCPASPPPGSKGTIDLPGYDDWANIRFQAQLGSPGTSTGVPASAELDRPRADAIREGVDAALSQADLSVSVADSPDPVAAGTALSYAVTVTNHDPYLPAHHTRVQLSIPSDLVVGTQPSGCSATGPVVTCMLGDIAPQGQKVVTITVGVPADLVYNNGGPRTVTATATVDHDGPDPVPSNNSTTASTLVLAVADLRVTGATASGPLELLLGQSGNISLNVGIANFGPSSPMDTVVNTAVTGGAGLTISPSSATSTQNALAVGSPRTISFQAQVRCDTPGPKSVDLTATIAPKNLADVDPDLTNNTRTAQLSVDCVVPIAINIRPNGFPNAINLNTDATLAALTTTAGEYGLPLAFDATKIDVSRTLWGLRAQLLNTATPTGAKEIHGIGHPADSYELNERTRDGDLDLILHFKPNQSGLKVGSTEACLKGKYAGPGGATWTFFGCDSVKVTTK